MSSRVASVDSGAPPAYFASGAAHASRVRVGIGNYRAVSPFAQVALFVSPFLVLIAAVVSDHVAVAVVLMLTTTTSAQNHASRILV